MLLKIWHEIICVIARRIICKWSAIKPFKICFLATLRVLHLSYPDSPYSSHTHTWSWRSFIISVGAAPVFEYRNYRLCWYVLLLTYPKFHLLAGRWPHGSKYIQAFKKTWIQLARVSLFSLKHNLQHHHNDYFHRDENQCDFVEDISHTHQTAVI